MKQLDIELIRYEKLKHVKFLVNRIQQRKEHIHNEFEIFVVLKGEGIAKIKSHTYDIKEGDVYLINSGEVHSYARNPNSNIIIDRNDDSSPLFLFAQISNHCLREQVESQMRKGGTTGGRTGLQCHNIGSDGRTDIFT